MGSGPGRVIHLSLWEEFELLAKNMTIILGDSAEANRCPPSKEHVTHL